MTENQKKYVKRRAAKRNDWKVIIDKINGPAIDATFITNIKLITLCVMHWRYLLYHWQKMIWFRSYFMIQAENLIVV